MTVPGKKKEIEDESGVKGEEGLSARSAPSSPRCPRARFRITSALLLLRTQSALGGWWWTPPSWAQAWAPPLHQQLFPLCARSSLVHTVFLKILGVVCKFLLPFFSLYNY